jgi:hypothetical protein
VTRLLEPIHLSQSLPGHLPGQWRPSDRHDLCALGREAYRSDPTCLRALPSPRSKAVHGLGQGPAEPPLSLETILGSQRDAVLVQGLGSLSQARLRQLLRHPRLLIDLQELIVSSGRPFWHARAGSALEQAPASDQRAAIDLIGPG